MNFAPRHVVAIVASVCAAIVLAPVGVLAATGQLVNLVDPILSDRKVRVGSGGSLQVETRPGVTHNAFNWRDTASGLDRFKLVETTGPTRIALSELTAGANGPVSTTSGHHVIDIVSYVQTTGTAACGTTGTGYSRVVLRQVYAFNMEPSIQVTFDGPPLIVPKAPSGKKACLQVEVSLFTTSSLLRLGATGFTFS